MRFDFLPHEPDWPDEPQSRHFFLLLETLALHAQSQSHAMPLERQRLRLRSHVDEWHCTSCVPLLNLQTPSAHFANFFVSFGPHDEGSPPLSGQHSLHVGGVVGVGVVFVVVAFVVVVVFVVVALVVVDFDVVIAPQSLKCF